MADTDNRLLTKTNAKKNKTTNQTIEDVEDISSEAETEY